MRIDWARSSSMSAMRERVAREDSRALSCACSNARRALVEEARARPRTNQSRGDQRHHQRLETVGATGEPERDQRQHPYPARGGQSHGAERIASARERREAAVREHWGRPLAAVHCPSRAPVEARAGSRYSIVGDERHERAHHERHRHGDDEIRHYTRPKTIARDAAISTNPATESGQQQAGDEHAIGP